MVTTVTAVTAKFSPRGLEQQFMEGSRGSIFVMSHGTNFHLPIFSAVFTWTNLLVVVAELDGPENEALDLVPLITNTVLVMIDNSITTQFIIGWLIFIRRSTT